MRKFTALIAMLIGIISATGFSMSQKLTSLKLTHTPNSYIFTWVAEASLYEKLFLNRNIRMGVKEFDSLKQALAWQHENYPQLTFSSETTEKKNLRVIKIETKAEKTVLTWNNPGIKLPIKISFDRQEDALFFQKLLAQGLYAPSPNGHSIRFTH